MCNDPREVLDECMVSLDDIEYDPDTDTYQQLLDDGEDFESLQEDLDYEELDFND